MLKTYKSFCRNLSIFATINGRVRCIKFSDMGAVANHGIYTTDKQAEQDALEARKDFGSTFILVGETQGAKHAAAAKEEPKRKFDETFPKVTKIQGAIKVLVEKYGISEELLSSKTDVLRQASSLNISFPNLK